MIDLPLSKSAGAEVSQKYMATSDGFPKKPSRICCASALLRCLRIGLVSAREVRQDHPNTVVGTLHWHAQVEGVYG
ncbi:hypothetical protein [Pseudomonas anguilliseptica]|uniref:hypothetical protein n=1 Tax=Pseudomonas anguilliseptica TaxID=53406 RepID=UPI00325BB58E